MYLKSPQTPATQASWVRLGESYLKTVTKLATNALYIRRTALSWTDSPFLPSSDPDLVWVQIPLHSRYYIPIGFLLATQWHPINEGINISGVNSFLNVAYGGFWELCRGSVVCADHDHFYFGTGVAWLVSWRRLKSMLLRNICRNFTF